MKSQNISFFFRNIISFLKALIIHDSLDWRSITSEDINCKFDNKKLIKTPYHLNNVTIGYGTYIARNAYISFTDIGKFTSIGPNFLCGWGIHPTHGISTSPSFYSISPPNSIKYSSENKFNEHAQISIGNDVFIGANVTVLDGITIGDGAVIGAGAVVSKNIPPYAIAVGCPIRIIKYRFSEEQIKDLLSIKWWNGNSDIYKKVNLQLFNIEQFISDNTKGNSSVN